MALEKIEERPFTRQCLEKPCSLRSSYLRERIRREALEEQIEKLEKGIHDYQIAIESLLSGIRTSIQPDHASLLILEERLKKIDNVSSLYYFSREGVIYLWVLEKKEDVESEIAIAQELSDLFSTFRDIRFDFIIVPLEDMKIEDILPSSANEVFSR